MSKDPAFLFYYQDFLVGTDDLTNEEVGAYIRCLCHQAAKGSVTEKHMKKICITPDVHDAIHIKFARTENGDFINPRLSEEMAKRAAYAESRRQNRQKKDMIKISKTYVRHMENENENENVIVNKDVLNVSFEDFYNVYGKKVYRVMAERRWIKLKPQERLDVMKHLPLYVQSTPEVEFRKAPSAYLNQRHWENEVILPAQPKYIFE